MRTHLSAGELADDVDQVVSDVAQGRLDVHRAAENLWQALAARTRP